MAAHPLQVNAAPWHSSSSKQQRLEISLLLLHNIILAGAHKTSLTGSMLTRIMLQPTLATGVHRLSKDRTSLVLPMVEEEDHRRDRLSGSNKDKTILLHGLTPIRSRISQEDLVALCSSRG